MTTKAEIDPAWARELRATTTWTWREIAVFLSAHAERVPPFNWQSVIGAVLRTYGTLKVPRGWRRPI